MASDSVHCKPPGGKVCVRNNGLVPIVAVHKKRESLLLAETLRPADSSEEGQIQLLPVPLHSRAKEDDVALGQLTTWAERAGFLPRTSWHRKPRVSVPKTSIGKSARNCVVRDRQRPLYQMYLQIPHCRRNKVQHDVLSYRCDVGKVRAQTVHHHETDSGGCVGVVSGCEELGVSQEDDCKVDTVPDVTME